MRKQDLAAVVVLAIVLSMIGIFAINSFTSSPSEKYTKTEEPEKIPEGFSEEGLEYIRSGDLFDFTVRVNGPDASKNKTPFGN